MGFKQFIKARGLKANDHQRTRAAELTLRESIYPICLVTVLFFLWGFSYGLLDTLNRHFQGFLGIGQARSAGLQAAYFGAYPVASIGHAAWILRHYGYKAVFLWGLGLYALGAILCIPAIKAKSFGGFCACIFIIGNGLGSLETAANPFITVCGPPRYSEMRINMSQAFNGIGTVIAPVLGSYVLFTFDDQTAIDNVQWIYLAIAVFVLLLALLFLMAKIPEITDADMAFQAAETNNTADQKPFIKQWKLWHATFAQFCYTGSQVAIASFFINYVIYTRPGTGDPEAARLFAGAQAAFAVGRFVGVAFMHWVKPRLMFLTFIMGAIIFTCPSITQGGDTGVAMLFVILFFESICFPTIVALGMRGLGRHTKRGSGYIVGGVIGGACVPPLTGAAADRHGNGIAMVVPLCFFLGTLTYAVCVNFAPKYVKVIDSFHETEIGVRGHTEDPEHGDRRASVEEKAATAAAPQSNHVS